MKKKEAVHIRRCHVCNHVSERVGASVDRCEHCGKPIAPFYFFDDFKVAAYSDYGARPDYTDEEGERVPVRGFTAIW